MVFVIRPVARRLFPPNEPPALGRFSAVMILLLASVWTTEALAVHALFGAFLAGLVMPKGGLLEAGLKERLESMTLNLLLPLFFAYTGLRTSLGLLSSIRLWLLCGLIVVVAVASKLVVSAVCVRASGMNLAGVRVGGSVSEYPRLGRISHSQRRPRPAYPFAGAFFDDGDYGFCHYAYDDAVDRLALPVKIVAKIGRKSISRWSIACLFLALRHHEPSPAPLLSIWTKPWRRSILLVSTDSFLGVAGLATVRA